MTTRIVFMGTPEFAVPSLKALVEAAGDQESTVVGVVTQPDRPKGRGKKLLPPPVKEAAETLGVAVLQPKTLKTDEAFTELTALRPDLIVVAAFGQILRKNVLDLPAHGCINVHASLLPRWRGAAPIAAAIRAGDAETGVTIMRMDEGLDTGPMIAKRSIAITPYHTAETLAVDLAELGAALLVETLPGWLNGDLSAQPQDDGLATFAPRLKKEEGLLDWTQPAVEIERQIRAFDPWPGTFTYTPRGQLKIIKAAITTEVEPPATTSPPGTIFQHERDVYVVTGQGTLQLVTVQPAGKKAMTAAAMLNGQPELLEVQLGSSVPETGS